MTFAGMVWRLLVGIKDGLVLLFLLLFFLALYGVLTMRPSASAVQDGALLLRLDGSVVEEPSIPDPLEMLLAREAPLREYRARDLARAIRLSADDERIKAVVLDLSRFTGGGQVHMAEIGAAMDAVRAAKKPVLTWAVGYADDGVQLAAHASEAWVDPLGGAVVMGPGGNRLFLKGLLDRFGVTAHIYRVGTYKDAVEGYIRTDQSPASKESSRALYGAVFETWRDDVRKARPKANLDLVTKDPAGWLKAAGGDAAKAALDAGLVDRVGDKVSFGERVKQLVGADRASKLPGTFATTSPAALLAAHPLPRESDGVAVVTVAGTIVDGRAGPGTAGGERVAALIDRATADEDNKALVLRVDSPGGSVMASEQIRLAVHRFRASGRPVAVSMANVAASGGYWVATPAQRIFAEPQTITGSIGIFMVMPSFEKALARYGITSDGIRTTPISGQPDLLGGLTPDIDAMLQTNIENGYRRFIGLVAQSRQRTPEQIDKVAQGRVWDGGTARQLGLVDEFGGLDAAMAWAAKTAKLDSWSPRFYGSGGESYASLLERLRNDDADSDTRTARDLSATLLAGGNRAVAQALRQLQALGRSEGMQALCLDCGIAVAPAQDRPPAGMLEWLGRLIKQ